MSCCPEYDRCEAQLQGLVSLSPRDARVEDLWAYLRGTGVALRVAGCRSEDEQALLLPVVLQLLLSPAVDDHVKADLRQWVEVVSTPRTQPVGSLSTC